MSDLKDIFYKVLFQLNPLKLPQLADRSSRWSKDYLATNLKNSKLFFKIFHMATYYI